MKAWEPDCSEWDQDYDEATAGTDRTDRLAVPEHLWNDTGHHGEIWLDESDGDWIDWKSGRTRKPVPTDVSVYCECGWPLPIRWTYRQCEFGGPSAWRSTDPDMEATLDDDPLLYRVAPWIWKFCECNGCVALSRRTGRPPVHCTKCARDIDNAKRRARYELVTTITSAMVDKQPLFVA